MINQSERINENGIDLHLIKTIEDYVHNFDESEALSEIKSTLFDSFHQRLKVSSFPIQQGSLHV